MERKVGKYILKVPEEINIDNFFKKDICIIEPIYVVIRAHEMCFDVAKALRYGTEDEIKIALRTIINVRESQLKDLIATL